MSKARKSLIDAGRLETEKYEPDEEIRRAFDEAALLGSGGRRQLSEKLRERHSTSPERGLFFDSNL